MCECTRGHEERCLMATSATCTCSCGGVNHGKGRPGVSDSESLPLTPAKVFKERSPMDFLVYPWQIEEVILSRDEKGVHTNVPRKYVWHSPTGFEWGYEGSGPADLALNILAMFIPVYWAVKYHQEFKRQYIAPMPKEGGLIPGWEIYLWIEEMFEKEEPQIEMGV